MLSDPPWTRYTTSGGELAARCVWMGWMPVTSPLAGGMMTPPAGALPTAFVSVL